MKYNKGEEGIRERLLVAGLKELEMHGFNDFSLRRVATYCDVSCAAPYKHFKNKEELIMALMDYIRTQWFMLRDHVMEMYKDKSPKERLIETCVAYVKFLLATPSYMTILTQQNDLSQDLRGRMSTPVMDEMWRLVSDAGMSDELRYRTLYAVRANIYGTVCLIRNKEVPEPEYAMNLFRTITEKIVDEAVAAAKKENEQRS